MTDSIEIQPVRGPVQGRVRPPGSKSITNRAMILAALADGTSTLTGVLDSDDTRVMADSLRRLGFSVETDSAAARAIVGGQSGRVPVSAADLFVENSGTSIRFLTALCGLGYGRFRLDGVPRMRERPIGDLVDALNQLGARARCEQPGGCPPVVVESEGLAGGTAQVAGTVSSQFLSALLMVAPACRNGAAIEVTGDLVSRPYIDMTLEMMREFGIDVQTPSPTAFRIPPQVVRSRDYAIEPDASAASYFFGVAAITGGSVTVEGLTREALQGDIRFVDVLERMGCQVLESEDSITVIGPDRLHGIEVDMNQISDTAQTLAVVAVFADSPTTITNVGHMRHKETDRIAAVVTELQRLGIRAEAFPEGLRIVPGTPRPATVQTYDDHRMAMSFALAGLRAEGIRIANPACTAKTYPNFFQTLDALCGAAR